MSKLLKWSESPDVVAAHEASIKILRKESLLAATFSHLSSEELGKLYFDHSTSERIRAIIVVQGQTPHDVLKNALMSKFPLVATAACVHHKLANEDLAFAAINNHWEIARKEILRVLERRREVGYDGSFLVAHKPPPPYS